MKDMSEASYVIGVKIYRADLQTFWSVSRTYINKVLERFRKKDCSPIIAPLVSGERFNLNRCPKNEIESEQMQNIPYGFCCRKPNVSSFLHKKAKIAFVLRMLGGYQSNLGMDHRRAAKEITFKGQKITCLCIDELTTWR